MKGVITAMSAAQRRWKKPSVLCAILVLCLALAGCSVPAAPLATPQAATAKPTVVPAPAVYPGSEWAWASSPESLGWSSAKLAVAEAYAKRIGSAAVIVVDDGLVVAAWGDVTHKYFCHSMRKSLMSALYGIYVAEGKIDLSATLKDLGVDDLTPLTEVEKTATDKDNASFPAFSPDGTRIAYVSSAAYMGAVHTMDTHGSDDQAILSRNRAMSDPDWSPDGRQIVFVFHTHAYFSISVMDADGSNFRELTRPVHEQSNDAPDWSPDGLSIAFSSDRRGDAEIYIMDADGGNVQQVTDNDTADWWPAWSPDGSQIAFTSYRDDNWDIYLMDIHGGNVQRLTDNPSKDWVSAWSPDGTQIAFASERDGNWEIYTMNVDGSQPRRLTHNAAQDMDPAWGTK
jgi:Tol biopolymer transport system component